jgi:hypothetical protein
MIGSVVASPMTLDVPPLVTVVTAMTVHLVAIVAAVSPAAARVAVGQCIAGQAAAQGEHGG